MIDRIKRGIEQLLVPAIVFFFMAVIIMMGIVLSPKGETLKSPATVENSISADKNEKCLDNLFVKADFNNKGVLKSQEITFSQNNKGEGDRDLFRLLGGSKIRDDDLICENAKIKLNIDDNSKNVSESSYNVNNLNKVKEYNDGEDNDKCTYVDSNGNSKIALCAESEIKKGNKIYDSVMRKANNEDFISQLDLNWKETPEKFPKIELKPFNIIVVDGLECQDFCN